MQPENFHHIQPSEKATMIKLTHFNRLLCCLLGLLTVLPAFAGSMGTPQMGGVENVAEREIARRQEYMNRASDFIAHGDRAMADKDYETAVSQYKTAVDMLPESTVTHQLRARAMDGFCNSSVKLAEQRIAEGRFADAETITKRVLEDQYNPGYKPAVQLLAHMEDPEYFNRTITPKFRANVEEVKKLMIEAQGFYDTARYDLAFKRYEQILNIDPYNIAARKGQERVNLARDNYAMQAYDETRSRAIWKVDKGWENPVRKYTKGETTVIEQGATTAVSNVAMINKLNRIIIPKIEFRDATVREAIDFLKQKSRELDVQEPDPTRRGVNIVLKLETSASYSTSAVAPAAAAIPGIESTPAGAAPAAPAVNPSDVRITLSLSNIPLMEALRYITNLAGLKVKIDPYAVAIVPLSEPTDVLVTKEYKVPPGFISNMPGAGASGALNQPASATAGGAKEATGAGSNIVGRQNAKDFLMANGVQFPEGASANFLAASSKLIVRNTQPNLDLIDTLVDAAVGAVPSQVDIESKFVEIQQTNTKELSFDWLLGQFNIPGSQRIFGGGGTSGTSPAVNAADYPFTAPGSTVPVGGFPVTAGNRSGNLAISGNAIDALLAGVTGGASSLAPSVFGLAGVFTDPQFQLVIRALNQKKGVDLLSAPRVTTKSGNKAVIEIIREFRYPTEFTPPQIPQNVGGSTTFSTLGTGVGGVGGVSQGSFPVTPTTPTSFETRNTGVTLEVEPVVGPDGYTIDLNLVPQVVEFEGFINYGSPIQSTSTNALGISITNVITPNVINQPIFSTRKVTTSVSIWDGQTVTLGGLMREDVQHTEDKVPLLGDIPGFGRLFRSSTDQHIKRNLIIFVTARLMNPGGEPINADEEKEEVVESTAPPEVMPLPPLPESPGYKK
jgi:general secretion pathway protein D